MGGSRVYFVKRRVIVIYSFINLKLKESKVE